jgi:hypothetical protein
MKPLPIAWFARIPLILSITLITTLQATQELPNEEQEAIRQFSQQVVTQMPLDAELRNLRINNRATITNLLVTGEAEFVNPPFAACSNDKVLYVSTDSATDECHFNSIADALAAIDDTSVPWVIQVAPGTYREPDLTLPINVSLAGIAPNTVVVQRQSNQPGALILPQGSNTISNLILDGQYVEDTRGIRLLNAQNVTILNVVGANFGPEGSGRFIVGNAPENLMINNCVGRNNGMDLLICDAEATGSVQNCFFSTTGVHLPPNLAMAVSFQDFPSSGNVILSPLMHGDTVYATTNISPALNNSTLGVIEGGVIALADQLEFLLGVTITAGSGYLINENNALQLVEWPATDPQSPFFIPNNNQLNYIYIDAQGNLQSSTDLPSPTQSIMLGSAYIIDSQIRFIQQVPITATQLTNNLNTSMQSLSVRMVDGCVVTNPENNVLSVTAGTYYYGSTLYYPTAMTTDSWQAFYHYDGLPYAAGQMGVDTGEYDNLTNRVPLTPGYYTNHVFYVVGSGDATQYLLVYGQAEYETLPEVQAAPLPTPPSGWGQNICPLATIIVQEGAGIIAIMDQRPFTLSSPDIALSARQGGNSLMADLVLGTNDQNGLTFMTDSMPRIVIDECGSITINEPACRGEDIALTIVGGGAAITGGTITDQLTLINQGPLIMQELSDNGSESVTVQAPASLPQSYALILPSSLGTANQLLGLTNITDSQGTLGWITPTSSSNALYAAILQNPQSLEFTTNVLLFDTVLLDTNHIYNPATGEFTIVNPGYYYLTAGGAFQPINAPYQGTLALTDTANGTIQGVGFSSDNETTVNLNAIAYLPAGDVLTVVYNYNGGSVPEIQTRATFVTLTYLDNPPV